MVNSETEYRRPETEVLARRGLVLLALAFSVSGLPSPVSGSWQCPDGAPPPCRSARPAAAPAANSVAVLYFDHASRDSTDAFLADGLTDELITRLSQVNRLEVRSRFESQRVRGQRAADPRALGRALRAEYLVTGSLQQVGQRVRVNVALVRAPSGAQVWGDIYDRAGDFLSIQSDIAREVAGAITGRLLPQEQASLARRSTRDPVAYNLYLRGVGAANTFAEAGVRAGIDYFGRAIARDSSFADAWVQLAIAWGVMADGYVEVRVGYPRCRDAAARAVRLDSMLALAHSALAACSFSLELDAAAAHARARRAQRIDPRSWLAHLSHSWAWFLEQQPDSGLAEARRGWDADTLSAVTAWNYLMTLSFLRRADAMRDALPRAAAALGPDDLREFEGVMRLARGDAAGAAERITWSYYGGVFAGEYVRALMALGRRDAARAVADSMAGLVERGYFNASGVARAYAELGDHDTAFAWMNRALDQRTNWIVFFHAEIEFTPMRSDPRWAAFWARVAAQ